MKRHFLLYRPLSCKLSIITCYPQIKFLGLRRTISQDVGINNLLCVHLNIWCESVSQREAPNLKRKRTLKKMEPVWLYVYDLSEGAAHAVTSCLRVSLVPGIWHSSIVVHNREIEYGRKGILCTDAGLSNLTVVNRHYLGDTNVRREVLEDYLRFLNSTKFKAENYNVVTFNCNVFANFLANELVHKNIPEYLLQIPEKCIMSGLEFIFKVATQKTFF